MRASVRATAACLVIAAVLVAGCSTGPTTAPAGSPTDEPAPQPQLILGCISIGEAECRFLAEGILGQVPADRGPVASLQVMLYGCPAAPGCARSLAARDGEAIVEFTDGGEPIAYTLDGPPDRPAIVVTEGFWSGLQFPASPPAGGAGPFAYEVGHCGLAHVVDFDTSFWVLAGEVDGDIPAMINSEQGRIRLLGPAVAEYLGADGSRARLARFPGPRFLRLCM